MKFQHKSYKWVQAFIEKEQKVLGKKKPLDKFWPYSLRISGGSWTSLKMQVKSNEHGPSVHNKKRENMLAWLKIQVHKDM